MPHLGFFEFELLGMAIKVLIENGVKEENIFFVNLISVPEGLKKMKEEYPKITIVTSEIDERLNESAYILPGIIVILLDI